MGESGKTRNVAQTVVNIHGATVESQRDHCSRVDTYRNVLKFPTTLDTLHDPLLHSTGMYLHLSSF
jgi:hypothetical protein